MIALAVAPLLTWLGGFIGLGGVLSALPYVGGAVRFLRSPMGKWLGVILLLAAVYGMGFWKGDAAADAKCNAAAVKAELEVTRIDRDIATGRAEFSAAVIDALQRAREENETAIAQMQAEIEGLRVLQSTKPGAKHDPRAIWTDECRVTGPGAKRLW